LGPSFTENVYSTILKEIATDNILFSYAIKAHPAIFLK